MKTATQKFEEVLTGPHDFPAAIRAGLDLDGKSTYDLGIIRTSLRSRDVLERQKETGINVYQHLPDFVRFGELDGYETAPEWIRIHRGHLDPRAGKSPVGFVGLIGRTVFIAVHDTAIKETLPPSPDDISGLGRNSFTELSLGVSRAADFANVYAASRDRWWRKDVYGHRLLEGLRTNCPGVSIWDGNEELDLSATGGLVNAVKGAAASSSASDRMEAAFEKKVNALRNGLWPLPCHHLPPGLRRKPIRSRGLTQEVELVPTVIPKITELLKAFAAGASYVALSKQIAELDLTVGIARYTRGPSNRQGDEDGRTARALFTDRNLTYWETGSWAQRCYTSLQTSEIKGHRLEYDATEGKWYAEIVCDQFPWPDTELNLTSTDWEHIHKRRERERRSRLRGAASRQVNTNRSAFGGVNRWVADYAGKEVEFLFAPEQATAYLIRIREPQERGARPREGEHIASFTKHLFDRSAGAAILEAIEQVTDPIKPLILEDLERHRAIRDRLLEELEKQIASANRAITRWEKKFETTDDPTEAARADQRAIELRVELRNLQGELESLRTAKHEENDPGTHIETAEANLTLPLLVADGLINSDKSVPPEIYEGIHRLHIASTLQGHPVDPKAAEPLWVFTATATVRLTDGGVAEVPLTWSLPSSKQAPSSKSRYGRIAADHWAKGRTPEEIGRAIGRQPDGVKRVMYRLMQRRGIKDKNRRRAALHCPIPETRAVIAAHLTGEPVRAADIPEAWRDHIANTYWGGQAKVRWQNPTLPLPLQRSRQILAELQQAGPDGIDSYPLANRLGQPHNAIHQVLQREGYVDLDGRRVRAKSCAHGRCNGLLTHRWPTPETGSSGLICHLCWRTEGGVVVPSGYLQPWEYIDGRMAEGTVPEPGPPPTPDDRLIGTHEAAKLLGLTYKQIVDLIDHGELASIRGPGSRGGNILLRERDIRTVTEAKLNAWRKRFDPNRRPDGRLKRAAAMALIGVEDPRRWQRLVSEAGLSHEKNHSRPHTFDPKEVLAIPKDLVRRYAGDRVQMAAVVERTGQSKETIVKLREADLFPSTPSNHRCASYILDEVTKVITDLGLAPGDELIRASEAADILGLTRWRFRNQVTKGATAPVVTTPLGTPYYSRAQIVALVGDEGTPPAS